jgi:predicted DCC family thiol-disulfide oxidoreductase YuxK
VDAPLSPPLVILFDGHCRFCTQTAKKLARRFGPSRVIAANFQEEAVLAAYPGVAYEKCMKKMHVVAPGGKVYAGAGAAARLVREVRFVGFFGYLYYVPVLRQLLDVVYFFVAKYRYKLFGKAECEPGGTCHLHG